MRKHIFLLVQEFMRILFLRIHKFLSWLLRVEILRVTYFRDYSTPLSTCETKKFEEILKPPVLTICQQYHGSARRNKKFLPPAN